MLVDELRRRVLSVRKQGHVVEEYENIKKALIAAADRGDISLYVGDVTPIVLNMFKADGLEVSQSSSYGITFSFHL